MSGQIEQLALHDGRIVKIEGPARSGKTEILARRCALLVGAGVDPETILVVVSSDFAVQEFRKRLASAMAAFGGRIEDSERVRVSRAVDVCVEVLDDPEARAITGRIPRILNDVEYRFFLEDLKTLGQKKQRLANMLAFFYAQWSKFEAEEDWVIPGEETSVLAHARKVCGLYGAMIRHEVPYVCGRLLASEEGKRFAQRYDYVFCDDFQNLSHAEQTCMCLCAKKQVIVCGDPNAATKVNTDYPSADGFLKFDRVRRGVETFRLETAYGIEGALRFGERLFGLNESEILPPQGAEGPGRAVSVEWDTPEEEFQGLAATARAALRDGESEAPVVVVPTVRWGLFASRVLSQSGIPSSTAGLRLGLGGDPRTPGKHDALSAYLRLRLAADPCDPLAWRAWGGLDNALTNSEMWESVQNAAIAQGMGLYDVVKAVGEGGRESFPEILKPAELERVWRSAQDFLRECQGLAGTDLAEAAGALECPEFAGLFEGLSGSESACDLCDMLERYLFRPYFPEDSSTVRIVLCECACGIECSCMVLLGAVDGMMPNRDAFDVVESEERRQKAKGADRIRLYSCVSKATRLLAVSSFAKAGIETAERARIQVARVTSKEGRRIALVSPSAFLKEAGEEGFEVLKGDERTAEELFGA